MSWVTLRYYSKDWMFERSSAMESYVSALRKTETFRAKMHSEPFFAGIVARNHEKTEQNSGGAPNFRLCSALLVEFGAHLGDVSLYSKPV
jgi:hypothetical protein